METLPSILLAFLLQIALPVYIFAVLSVPELMIGRLLQSLAHMLEHNRISLSKGQISLRTFCANVDVVRNSFHDLTKVFGNNMMLLVLMSLVQLIWKAYFLINSWRDTCSYHNFYEIPNGGGLNVYLNHCKRCTVVHIFKNAVLCYVFVKRLVYLTSRVHELHKQASKTKMFSLVPVLSPKVEEKKNPCKIGDTMERLISYKSNPELCGLVTASAELLDRSKNLSVRGFFIVDRAIFPALLASFLTYFIIIVQFRL